MPSPLWLLEDLFDDGGEALGVPISLSLVEGLLDDDAEVLGVPSGVPWFFLNFDHNFSMKESTVGAIFQFVLNQYLTVVLSTSNDTYQFGIEYIYVHVYIHIYSLIRLGSFY